MTLMIIELLTNMLTTFRKPSNLKLVMTVNFYQVYTRSPGSANMQNSTSDIVEITSVFRVMYRIVQNYSSTCRYLFNVSFE